MSKDHEREKWLQDIDARQRNIVFPDTVQNDGRLWRNLGNPAFNTAAKVGLGLLGVFVYGYIASLALLIRRDTAWKHELAWILLLFVLIFGPIFTAIVWATRRSLKNIRHQHSKHPTNGR